jgi:hypothetical protein
MSGDTSREVDESHVRQVRVGHGANCSSIGSVIDTLFATAAVGAAVFAAVAAALRNEEVRVVGGGGRQARDRGEPERSPREGDPG